MSDKNRSKPIIRWLLSVILVVAGLSITWAWGRVASLAEPQPTEAESQPSALYALWQPEGAAQVALFRSTDEGATWQPLSLPPGAEPVVWATGGEELAVAMDDGSLLRSQDQGEHWIQVMTRLPILSLAWGEGRVLYLGTDGQGVYRLTAAGSLDALAVTARDLAISPVRQLAFVDGRLFAATPTTLFYTDDARASTADRPPTWSRSQPLPEGISSLAALDRQTVFAGSEIAGVYRSADAAQSWQPAAAGLGLAAGQMVRVTALRTDPQEAEVLYAAVDYLVGGTQVHASAAGTFVSVDGGSSWQPLAGTAFPEARQATDLVVAGRPLYVQAVTADGLQGYALDVAGALTALKEEDPQVRATAARMLGFARSQEAGDALLAALDDPEPGVSLAAADALGRINDPATASGLLVALEHPDQRVRLNAARALGAMRVEAAVEPLRTMLIQGDEVTIAVAADALRHIGGQAATEALLVALADAERTPRWHAALGALEAMGEPAVGPLSQMLGSEDAGARQNAAEALGWVGSPSATAVLLKALNDGRAEVREQAAWALGEIGDPTARAALERLQARDPSAAVQLAAQTALDRIERQPATVVRWPATWAPALNRLQPLRWSILALALAGAMWLVVGQRGRSLLPVFQRERRP